MVIQPVNILGTSELKYDPKWLELIGEAKRSGLTQEEIRYFLRSGRWE